MKLNWKLYVGIVLLLVFIPIWNIYFAPKFESLPDDFSYEVDLLSIDNFFNEERNSYDGEQISRSEFLYETVDVREDSLLINNSFEVFTLAGEKIISLSRILGVDKKTGEYVSDLGDKAREGSLFAPIGHKPGESFTYWHVNYDVPFEMNFVAQEEIDGLIVNKYETERDKYVVDQTDFLTNLPGVPEERGVEVVPYFQIWIEPVSGYMVQFEDKAEAYYYDIESGDRLNPWNSFSNEFTESSTENKVEEAVLLKWKYYVIDYIVPFFVFTLALALILLHLKTIFFGDLSLYDLNVIRGKSLIYGFILISLVLVTTLIIQYQELNYDYDTEFKIGIVVLVESDNFSETIEAYLNRLNLNGFIEGENLTVLRETANGDRNKYIDIIRKYEREDVDLIYTFTTQAVNIAREEVEETPLVFNVVTYPVEEGIIDSYESSKNNIVGVRHIVPVSGQWYEFNKILSANEDLSFDRIVYVSGRGYNTTERQFEELNAYFANTQYEVERLVADDLEDLERQLAAYDSSDIFYAGCDIFMQNEGGDFLVEYGLEKSVVVTSCIADLVRRGALFSRSVDWVEIGEIAADKSSLILMGSQPDWLRTEQPQRHKENINLETAEKLGIVIPLEEFTNFVTYPN